MVTVNQIAKHRYLREHPSRATALMPAKMPSPRGLAPVVQSPSHDAIARVGSVRPVLCPVTHAKSRAQHPLM